MDAIQQIASQLDKHLAADRQRSLLLELEGIALQLDELL